MFCTPAAEMHARLKTAVGTSDISAARVRECVWGEATGIANCLTRGADEFQSEESANERACSAGAMGLVFGEPNPGLRSVHERTSLKEKMQLPHDRMPTAHGPSTAKGETSQEVGMERTACKSSGSGSPHTVCVHKQRGVLLLQPPPQSTPVRATRSLHGASLGRRRNRAKREHACA